MARAYMDDEIVDMYINAEHKEEQIEILAQLNDCDQDTIIEILNNAGVYEGKYKICNKCGREFLGETRRGHSNACPECRAKIATYSRSKSRLIKNLKKIQELSEENMEIMRFLEKEKKYEGKNKRGAK